MNYLSAELLSKSFSERWLFKDISLGIDQGEKLVLVGENGTGKTTLLRMLAGELPPDSGNVVIRDGVRVAFLRQEPQIDKNLFIKDYLFSADNPVAQVVKEYEICIHGGGAPGDLENALEKMESLNAWGFEERAHEILSRLGIENLDSRMDQLSGGQRKRVALAQLLLQDPDLIIMDEPTNHLDLKAIEWLENLLKGPNITLIMVTHDRYFLDAIANTILELDRGKLYKHVGNYAYFLEQKEKREGALKQEVTKARNLLRKELEWMRRQPKARGTKAKYRIEAFHELEKKASQSTKRDKLELEIKQTRQGGNVLELDSIGKQFESITLFQNFSYIFKKKDRIGVVGKNGVGKSTFLNILTGLLKPDSGEVIRGVTTKVGYFTQESENLKLNNRVIDEVKDIAEFITMSDGSQLSASAFLNLFLFPPEKQYTFIEKLSGGEKKRLQLLKILINNPNFLVLDEPTNDFDIDTLNVLEEFLDKFSGCLVLVSHDRYFMDHLVDQLFVFEGEGHIKTVNGNYSDYREMIESEEVPGKNENAKPPITKPAIDQKEKKASFKEVQEYERLQQEIEALENKKQTLVDMLSENLSHDKLFEVSTSIKDLTNQIEDKTARWIHLDELITQ